MPGVCCKYGTSIASPSHGLALPPASRGDLAGGRRGAGRSRQDTHPHVPARVGFPTPNPAQRPIT